MTRPFLGEAVKRLSPEFISRVPEVRWKSIAGMRDKLIHHYDVVDLELVWKAISEDVPRLLATLEPLAPRKDLE